MDYLEILILAIVQGLTEFIPVSSSGHLILGSYFLDVNLESAELNALIVFLHLGTLISVFIYYRKRILELFKFDEPSKKLTLNLVVGSIPAFAFGFLFTLLIERNLSFNNQLWLAIFGLISAGSIFIYFSKTKHKEKSKSLTLYESVKVGFFQSLGIIYGVSRSGITLIGTKFTNVTKNEGIDFTFLLSIPAILGAVTYSFYNQYENFTSEEISQYVFGILISASVGYLAISWLINYLKNNNLRIFGIYCLSIGIITSLIVLIS